ncbi:MAG: GAF domain-containing protein [Anaerolineales bacterium]|jgi:PAS domain S-box-containing protein
MSSESKAAERARASLELLYSISRELAAQLDLPALLKRILQLTREKVGATSGSILVLDEKGAAAEGSLVFEGKLFDHTADQLLDTLEHGLAGWVVKNRKAALLKSTLDDPRWFRRPDDQYDQSPRSAISLPLITQDRVVGVLTLLHPEVGHFTDEDLALLTAIADQAGIAVENARLFSAEQERRTLASTLREIAHVISSTLDRSQVFPQVLAQLERVVEFDSASILLLEGDQLRLEAARGFDDDEAVIGLMVPVSPERPAGRVLENRQPVVIEDVQKDPGWLKIERPPDAPVIHGWIGVPLMVGDRAVGVLCVDSHQIGAYGTEEVEIVAALGDHAATAVANAQLYEESQRQLQATLALSQAAREVTASLNPEEVLQRILAQTVEILQVEAASLALVDQATGELEFKVALGPAEQKLVGMRLSPGEGIAGWVAEHEQTAVVADAQTDPRFSSRINGLTSIKTGAVVCTPIRVKGQVIGVLEAINPVRGEFLPDQVDLLKGIAGLAGTAIAHARLFDETQAARERYLGLFEDSVDSILIAEPSGVISDVNLRAQEFTGFQRQDLQGKPISDLYEADSAQSLEGLSDLALGQSLSFQGTVKHVEAQSIPVEVHVKCIELDGQAFHQWIMRDTSERQELDNLREDLTSMIFHDLRSPLGNVISSLEILQASLPPLEDEGLTAILSIAMRSSRRVSRLVESLLDVGRLESGKAVLSKSEGMVNTLIDESIAEVRPIADAKGHTLEDQSEKDLPPIEMDQSMIQRVLINLMENAIKYTPSGGCISVSAGIQDEDILIQVRDTGPGIDASDQQRLFEKFTTIHREGRPKGLGLGLAFCRLAVGAHGGRIWVESEPGEGATFSFTLPRASETLDK